jgi:hypothetical protein
MERKRVGDMAISKWAGLTFTEYREAIEFAKMMAQARNSIPGYLKQNPGDCLAIVTQSLRWRLEPYWVAQHSYIAKSEALIAYDAAVHAAIVISSGILEGRPRYTYAGEGEERTCTVTATFIGEREPHDYTTPPLRQCRPPKNEHGVIKGSPLWSKDVDQQLGYYAMRNWGRRHCPELLGGVYDREEFEHTTQTDTDIVPPSPNLMARLPGKMEGAGFQTDVVDAGLAKEAEAKAEEAKTEKKVRKATGTATASSESVAEAAPAQTLEPEKPAPGPPVQPQTAEQYMAYAAKWIEKGSDPDDLAARWDGEVEMRQALKVPLAVRKRLDGMMVERIAELRKETKKRR